MAGKPRKPLLDAVKRSEICAILSVGGSRSVAARYVGCSRSTIVRTAQRDPAFARQLARAGSKHEIVHLKNIDEAAKSKQYWRAAAWVLEHQYPERYAARPPDTVGINQVGQLLTQFARLVVEELPNADDRQRVLSRLESLVADAKAAKPSRRKRK